MIETREAPTRSTTSWTPGNGVFVGPSDLSIALHRGAVVHPHGADVDAMLTKLSTRAKAHGKFAAALLF